MNLRNCVALLGTCMLTACVGSPPSVDLQHIDFESCEFIVGDYDAYGTDVMTERLVSYRSASRLPKSDAAQVLRLSFDRINQRLVIQQLTDTGDEVSVPQRLSGDCVAGHWLLRHSYKGGADGTRFEGVDVFDFHRLENGHLLFRFDSEGTITRFIALRPYKDSSAVRFAQRKPK